MPKQHSSGGKDRLGSISKRGDRYLRGLFVAGALAVIRYAKIHGTKHRPWLTALGLLAVVSLLAMTYRMLANEFPEPGFVFIVNKIFSVNFNG